MKLLKKLLSFFKKKDKPLEIEYINKKGYKTEYILNPNKKSFDWRDDIYKNRCKVDE